MDGKMRSQTLDLEGTLRCRIDNRTFVLESRTAKLEHFHTRILLA